MITVYDKSEHDDEFIEIPKPRKGCWIHVEDTTINGINLIPCLMDNGSKIEEIK